MPDRRGDRGPHDRVAVLPGHRGGRPAVRRRVASRRAELIDELLAAFGERAAGALGDRLVSLYVFGSAAFPGFQPHVADIDFHAIVRAELSDHNLRELDEVHSSLARDFPHGELIDGYYLPFAAAEQSAVPVELQWAANGRMGTGGGKIGAWALERAHVHAGAYVQLRGRDPKTILPVPRPDEVDAALDYELTYVAANVERAPVFAVLNLCRLAYSRRTGDVVVSKLQSAEWALEELDPRWRPLIRSALAAYHGRASGEDEAAMRSGAVGFLNAQLP